MISQAKWILNIQNDFQHSCLNKAHNLQPLCIYLTGCTKTFPSAQAEKKVKINVLFLKQVSCVIHKNR